MKNLIKSIDWSIIFLPLLIIILVSGLLIVSPETVTNSVSQIQYILNDRLGFVYMIFGFAVLVILLTISISPKGSLKLGECSNRYSEFSWGTMIVTGTFAADLLYWSFIEWSYYYGAKPKGLEMTLVEAQDAASTYTLFHWGPIPWAIYLVPAVAYAYQFYVKGVTKTRLSSACKPILGNKVDGVLGKVIDIIALVGLLAGTATTFSVTTPLMSALVSKLFNIPQSNSLTIIILLIIALIYTLSVFRGLKGISVSAKLCTVLFSILIALIFIPGPKTYILESGLSGIGNMLDNFIGLSTWTDPTRSSDSFPQSWTIFYWSYWIAWAVATPLFIAKISKGRTIREVLLKGLAYGLLGTYLSFIIISNSALYQQVSGTYDATADLLVNELSPESVIINIISNYPLSEIISIVLLVTMALLYSTTFDSIIMTTTEYCSKSAKTHSSKLIKVLWAIIFISLPIALIYSESTLDMLKQLSIIAAFPLMIILSIIIIGLLKELYSRPNKR